MPNIGYLGYLGPGKRTNRGSKALFKSRRKRCDLRVPPTKQLVHPQHRHLRKHKTEILLWLIDNRIAITTANSCSELYTGSSAATTGTASVPMADGERQAFVDNRVIYRPPTYKEAGAFWKVSEATISRWWKRRERYLSPDAYGRSNKLPVHKPSPGWDVPNSAPHPRILSEITALADITGITDITDMDDNIEDDDSDTATEVIDDSDIELDDDEDRELPELEATLNEDPTVETRRDASVSSDDSQEFQDAPEYQI
ncbi:hypothetical protein SAMD00023353_0601720 [Rosellinia necatrix]|uniref:Uncharacterized protein n=1 Tax=Rosellinia necatrix TaxID=77044 RepID=A0A1S7UNV3_ROSNE|nr:hypothetical protein SAMD00023353_0601720 [Rosellinia necatrix]